jgi:hypothetical protein
MMATFGSPIREKGIISKEGIFEEKGEQDHLYDYEEHLNDEG